MGCGASVAVELQADGGETKPEEVKKTSEEVKNEEVKEVKQEEDTEQGEALGEEDGSADDVGPFQVMELTRTDGKVRILEFGNKRKASMSFNMFKQNNRAALMVKDNVICPGMVCGELYRIVLLIGLGFGKGCCDMGPCATEGSEYCIFPDHEDSRNEGDGGEEEGEEGDDGEEGAWSLMSTRRDGEGISHVAVARDGPAIKRFEREVGKDMAILLVRGGGVVKFRGDGGDGGDMDDEVHKKLAFLVGVAFGKGLISDLGPFEDGGAYPIFGEGFADEDDGSD